MNYIVTVQGGGKGGSQFFRLRFGEGHDILSSNFGEGQYFLAAFFKTSVALPPPVNNDRSLKFLFSYVSNLLRAYMRNGRQVTDEH